jgi:ubiquinone/menaquinone biosynthesis C-methylase UbiE
MQTVELVKLSKGQITAIDIYPQYLDQLRAKAEEEAVSEYIQPMEMSMDSMNFEKESFDIIWSEGAIFIIGFEKGLREWRAFLKQGGYLVVSEMNWIKANPPKELKDWLEAAYPPITSIKEDIAVVQKVGYELINHFILPEAGWWEHYYKPIEKRLITLRRKYDDDPEALKYLEIEELEIEFYRKYSDYYGYVFYIMRK